jgi:hypothetical protein
MSAAFPSSPTPAAVSPPPPPPSHPTLVSLRVVLNAVESLERYLHPSSSSSTAKQGEAASAVALSSSPLIASERERDWDALTKQLRVLVDQTHPDSERATSGPQDDVMREKGSSRDGRAVMLAWNASGASLSTDAPSGGDVTRVFSFLQRLAVFVREATVTSSSVDPTTSSHSFNGSVVGNAASAVKESAKTKAQMQLEDIVEPAFLYGCAVASNLASAVAGGRRSRRHQRRSTEGAADGTPTTMAPTVSAVEEEAKHALLGNTLWGFVVTVTQLYRAEKRLTHLLLSVLSNVVGWPELKIDSETCAFLYQLITPFYSSYAMVAAWVTMLCNLTAVHGAASVPTLLRLGVVADVERLSLAVPPSESPTTERLVVHSVQLLSNIAMHVFKDGGAGSGERA